MVGYKNMAKNDRKHIYSIRQLIELTGLSEFTLRGWETRYQAFNPSRSETGRRLYSKDDIVKIRLLMRLLNQGHRIGMVAHLDLKELELLAEKTIPKEDAVQANIDSKVEIARKIGEIISLASRFEWEKIQKALTKAQESFVDRIFVLEFLLGLVAEINDQIEMEKFSVAQEHIMTALMKKSLYARLISAEAKSHNSHRFILAAPEGDFHDLALLIAEVLLSLRGIKSVNLGPHVPRRDLCETSLRYNATHVLLSSTFSGASGTGRDYLEYVNFVDRQLEKNVSLFLGGRNAVTETLVLKRKFHIFKAFSEFDTLISQLGKR